MRCGSMSTRQLGASRAGGAGGSELALLKQRRREAFNFALRVARLTLRIPNTGSQDRDERQRHAHLQR